MSQTATAEQGYDFNEFLHKDKKQTPTPAPSSYTADSHEQKRVWTYIEGIAGNQAALIEGSRNDRQNSGAYKAFRLALGVGIPLEQVEQLVYRAQVLNGQVEDDGAQQVRSTMRSARTDAERAGAEYLAPPEHAPVAPAVVIDPGEMSASTQIVGTENTIRILAEPATRIVDVASLERGFWERESLHAIYTAALARMCAPWAVLAHCVARALAFVPTTAVLPPLIGGDRGGSLNWYAVAVDRSGGGKSAAAAVAKSLVPYSADTRLLGSGEGLVECYWPAFEPPKDGDGDFVNTHPKSFVFQADEIDTIGALSARSGSTLMPHLRTAFTGGMLGAGYKGRTTQIIPEQEYRLTLVVSAQPRRCASILADADGGTPQRFMWFPANDPRISAAAARPFDPVQPLSVATDYRIGKYIKLPEGAQAFILAQCEARGRGRGGGIDGHAVFCREKFAYGLAVLDGHNEISADDWELSGIAADVSEATREWAAACVADSASEDAEQRGRLQGVSAVAADEEKAVRASERTKRVGRQVLDRLESKGPMTEGAIRQSLGKQARPWLVGALQALRTADVVALDEHQRWSKK